MVRELPSLDIGRGSLGPRRLEGSRSVKGPNEMEVGCFRWKKAPTLLILWKPYILSCLTKLENCSKAKGK